VKTPVTSQWIAGVEYWPASSVAYRIVGTHDENVERYAPRLAVVFTSIARKRPSRSSASFARVTWSRPCASVMNDSERSAVHFTGRPSCFAAHVTTASSA
jgi:hypothetical protein